MTDIARLRSLAAERVDAYLMDLEQLVNIDSGTYGKAGVDAAGAAFREMLTRIGCEISVHPQETFGDNFTATLRGSGQRRLMLVGHFDTVYPAGTTRERPFSLRADRAYGPGTCDMKGGLVLGLHALQLMQGIGFDDFAEITFVANGDEEIGSPTSRSLIESTARPMDAVLVLEPGRVPGGMLATRKGVGMYELQVHGRASHAGATPREGRSANLELAHKIIALHDLNDFDRGTTVSVNLIQGGTARNVIPAYAEAGIDVRVMSREEAESVDAAIQAIADQSVVPDTRATLRGGLNRPPMVMTHETKALLDVAEEWVEAQGQAFEVLASGGGSDGNFTAALGVPTLDGLGPVGRNAHSVNEYIELDSIPERLALLTALLMHAPARSGVS